MVGAGSSPSVVGPEVHGSHVEGARDEVVPEGAQAGAQTVAQPGARTSTQAGAQSAQAVVIAIAGSVQERLRIAEAVGETAAVVMVGSRAEAMDILAGSPGVSGLPALARPQGEPQHEVVAVPHPPVRPLPAHQPPLEPGSGRPGRGLAVDSDWRVARVGDREVGLSPLEHDLLVCLLAEVGHIHTFESIQRRVWGNDHLGDRSHVQSVVKRLRRKLTGLGSPVQIDAVRGVGLRLVQIRRERSSDAPPVPAARTSSGD